MLGLQFDLMCRPPHNVRCHLAIAGNLLSPFPSRWNLERRQADEGAHLRFASRFDTNWCQSGCNCRSLNQPIGVGFAEFPLLPAVFLEGSIVIQVEALVMNSR